MQKKNQEKNNSFLLIVSLLTALNLLGSCSSYTYTGYVEREYICIYDVDGFEECDEKKTYDATELHTVDGVDLLNMPEPSRK